MEFMTRPRHFGKGSAEFCVYHLMCPLGAIHTLLVTKPVTTSSNRIYDLRSSGQLQLPPLEACAFH